MSSTLWNYRNPVAVHAGAGSLAQLSEWVGDRRTLLVTFPEAVPLGLLSRIEPLLGDRLVAVESDIQPNPDVSWIAPMYERLWREHADAECIVALGGGSAIDCAKIMLVRTANGCFDELMDILEGRAPVPPESGHRALIAVPTTAGTGSEVTPWATLWDQAGARKLSLHLPCTWPQAAIVDAALMCSLPAATTLASGLDALSHALESIWNKHRNPVSAALAMNAARAIVQTLPALMREPARIDLREAMATAALQAGMAFSNTKTALAHSLSYDVTLATGTAHGIACSFCLPKVMALAFGHDAAVDSQMLAVFGASDAQQAISVLEDFLHSLGVSTDPADYGIAASEWQQRVQTALAGPRGQNFIATP
ncbi:iron-containing alcohol dehydrogenase [Pandoraea sp. XJJ-1]|uniref:NAD-dependent methanol dehydrogenase n=1 Tax=Variovorax paradoxus TaxID=34073 RepID=A0A0H2M6U3_VARPD|nr:MULTISPECIES: iron-containing alcohol dehydrogenase PsrA [Pseudomonadota]KLN58058.1 NAD-dependent methanol dehydrogenase [Variovorax paradoxus]MBL0607640.1 iron-containing alcohol dehydrogenase [Aeromonas caviae]WAL82166.1 iron-containing alcohol dehydrogenase [Pandoraea sp. XJJ-1]